MDQAMTRDEFIAYAAEALSPEALECVYEQIAEHNNEVAMFGDAGPGVGLVLHARCAEIRGIARRYEQLTGIHVPLFFRIRSPQ